MGASGWAHSILDIDKIVGVGEPDSPGAMRAMSAEEMRDVLGSDRLGVSGD